MDKTANPLDYLLANLNEANDKFLVENAKDELNRLRKELDRLNKIFEKPIAWAKATEKGDLYDLRLQQNPYDKTKIIALYGDI